jgi:glycine/D-amino acid oxidase-like deaminating enzyme/nitrite reductase/ring-hydroxylating ferredoxin subunit
MNVEQERSRSLWMQTPAPRLSRLGEDLETDLLVIGAGIMGLMSAYELARNGRRITVIDRGRFGRGMTARTTAHLAFEIDDSFHELKKAHGAAHARLWYASQSAAVDRFEAICRDEGIACEFARLDGFLIPAHEKDVEHLRKELDAAREAGFADAESVAAGSGPGFAEAAIRFPRQARLHPLKFISGLVDALLKLGVAMYEQTDVTELEEKGEAVIARTGAGATIRAHQAIVATNAPFHLRVPIHTKQAPYRTYVIAGPIPSGSVADILLWDTAEPGYHYVRLQPGIDGDILIVGGEDHKTGTQDDGQERIERLEQWARARYPQMGRIAFSWSGQVYEPADYVGFVGKSPEHDRVFVATGDSGQGMTTGGVAGLLLRDLVNGRPNAWAELYDPSRQMHRGLGEYVKENLEAAKHWVELVGPGEVASLDKLEAREGALVRLGGKPVAAYRDDSGQLHLRSAVCTHAGCAVHWNSFEGCWDCPCHGSQFDVEGQVLNGPAATELAPVSAGDGAKDRKATRAAASSDADRQRSPPT